MLNNYFWWINVEFRPLWFCCVTVFCSFIDLSDFFAPVRQRWECCRTPKGRERRAFFASSVGRLSWRVFALLHFNGHVQYGHETARKHQRRLTFFTICYLRFTTFHQLFQVQKSFGKQLKQLAKRELRAVVRDRTTLAVRCRWSLFHVVPWWRTRRKDKQRQSMYPLLHAH